MVDEAETMGQRLSRAGTRGRATKSIVADATLTFRYNRRDDGARVAAVHCNITDGPKAVVGRRVWAYMSIEHLRDFLAFAERVEADCDGTDRVVTSAVLEDD